MAVVPGTPNADTLDGTSVADVLQGFAGNDTLFGSDGSDVMDGGTDVDTVDYSLAQASVFVDLFNEMGFGGDGQLDTYTSIENATGSGFDDVMFGSLGANRIDGGAGNDFLAGDLGADTLIGGTGIDTATYDLSGVGVIVNLSSGQGFNGEAQGDILNGIENLIGSNHADNLIGDTADNNFDGGASNDTLMGVGGNDTLLGGDGDDWLDGGTGNDSIDGGTGINTADYNASTSGVKVNLFTGVTSGGFGVDSIANIANLIGSEFNDSLTGDTNDNILVGSTGADTLIGGGGIDTADYTSAGGAVSVSLLLGKGLKSVAAGDVLSGIENLTGSAFNDSLTGDTGDNLLVGLDGNDSLLGGDGADTLIGGTGTADLMTGGAGNDIYFVDSTTDKISEGTTGGFDLVYSNVTYSLSIAVENLELTGTDNIDGTGNSSANTLLGNAGHNALSGGSGNDALFGETGNDTLNGGSGVDAMQGGNGDDTYFIDNLLDTIDEAGTTGHDTVNSTVAWTLAAEFEDLTLTGSTSAAGTGNAGNNVLNGNIGSNLLTGLGGNDSIMGDFTTDTLHGGNDTLDGGAGVNVLIGGLGNDTYIISTGTDTIIEEADGGVDVVRSDVSYIMADNVENLILTGLGNLGGFGNDLDNAITGNDGDNNLTGGDGADTLTGGIGDDMLVGGTGADSMVGGLGDDDYVVDDAADKTIEGAGAGIDLVSSSISFTLASNLEYLYASGTAAIDLTGNTLNNLIIGNDNANLLDGSNGDDTLIGELGDDTLSGGSGADSMSAGDGDDHYVVDDAADLTIEVPGEGTDTVVSSINWTLQDNTENLELTGTTGPAGIGNDLDNTITGTTGANALSGLAGDDTLNGDLGNDSLTGGGGDDLLSGGGGNDTYVITATDTLVELADDGTDLVKAAFTYTLLDNFENLTLTGTDNLNGTGNAAANVINGNSGANQLSGLDGDDTIIGGDGDDVLTGGTGADSMSGGAGADIYFVDDAGDKVVETSAKQIDLVVSNVSFTLGAYVENLELAAGALDGTGNSVANLITGNGLDNTIMGLGGNDTMTGAGGADTLNGGTGNDTMTGGNGNDTYVVNSLLDVVSEVGTNGHDTVLSSVNYILATELEDLTLTGANRINATGNASDNIIIGNAGINKIAGLEGDDTLTGDLGADDFIFTSTTSGIDTITDFNGLVSGTADGDQLQFAASLLVGTFAYVGGAGFSGGSDNTEARMGANGRVVIDTDGNGTGDITIFLTGLVTEDQLTIADFTFV